MLGMYLAVFGLCVLGLVYLLDWAFDRYEAQQKEQAKPQFLGDK